MIRLALVGDPSPQVVAHEAIPRALQRLRDELGSALEWTWFPSPELAGRSADLAAADGLWIVPGSPYRDTEAVLQAIRAARESRQPVLGTCGGFQHLILEFARNVLGIAAAGHGETHPEAAALLITPLACALVGQTGTLRLVPDGLLAAAYGRTEATEAYHCRYGPNPEFRDRLEAAGFRFTAFDANGEIRAGELSPAVHPFYCGTLFQPERAALRGVTPPLARAWVVAAARHAASR